MGSRRTSTVLISAFAAAFLMQPVSRAAADQSGFPVELVKDGKKVEADWPLLGKGDITKPWKLCVLFPHLKDSYWLAADYGIVQEATNANVEMQLYEAGGYTNLSTQLNQLDNCIAQKYDAIVLGAISADGVGALVRKAKDAGIPVIDFVNGVNGPDVAAHALVSFHDLAYTTGQYLASTAGGKPLTVGFFPGPQGAGWSDDAVRGFEEGIKGADIKIAVTRRGDTGLNVQLDLINNALQTYPDINYLVGVDIAGQAAAVAVRTAGLQGNVKVAAFDIIPPVYDDIANGAAEAAPTDFTVLQGRLAVDMALRLLEKKDMLANRAGPKPVVVTAKNYKSIPFSDMFAPKNFTVQFSVKPK